MSPAARNRTKARPRTRRHRNTWHARIRTRIEVLVLRILATVLGHTWRFHQEGHTEYDPHHFSGPVIYCFWHAQILQFAFGYRRCGICAVVSASRDGELATRLARFLGHDVIRGSSSRGGLGALRASMSRLKTGGKLAMIPDGPRGPARQAKEGVAHIACASGAPIMPVSAVPSRYWRLGSWDGFVIPKPFARIEIRFHQPIYPHAHVDSDTTSGYVPDTDRDVQTTSAPHQAGDCMSGNADDAEVSQRMSPDGTQNREQSGRACRVAGVHRVLQQRLSC